MSLIMKGSEISFYFFWSYQDSSVPILELKDIRISKNISFVMRNSIDTQIAFRTPEEMYPENMIHQLQGKDFTLF